MLIVNNRTYFIHVSKVLVTVILGGNVLRPIGGVVLAEDIE